MPCFVLLGFLVRVHALVPLECHAHRTGRPGGPACLPACPASRCPSCGRGSVPFRPLPAPGCARPCRFRRLTPAAGSCPPARLCRALVGPRSSAAIVSWQGPSRARHHKQRLGQLPLGAGAADRKRARASLSASSRKLRHSSSTPWPSAASACASTLPTVSRRNLRGRPHPAARCPRAAVRRCGCKGQLPPLLPAMRLEREGGGDACGAAAAGSASARAQPAIAWVHPACSCAEVTAALKAAAGADSCVLVFDEEALSILDPVLTQTEVLSLGYRSEWCHSARGTAPGCAIGPRWGPVPPRPAPAAACACGRLSLPPRRPGRAGGRLPRLAQRCPGSRARPRTGGGNRSAEMLRCLTNAPRASPASRGRRLRLRTALRPRAAAHLPQSWSSSRAMS